MVAILRAAAAAELCCSKVQGNIGSTQRTKALACRIDVWGSVLHLQLPGAECRHAPIALPLPSIHPRRYLVTLGGLGHPGGVMLQVITGAGRHR